MISRRDSLKPVSATVAAANAIHPWLSWAADSPATTVPGKYGTQPHDSECHGSPIIVQQRLSKPAWTKEIDKMIRWGALVDPADHDAFVDHLSANFPPDKSAYVAAKTAPQKASMELASHFQHCAIRCVEFFAGSLRAEKDLGLCQAVVGNLECSRAIGLQIGQAM